jgi:transcriptional regulator with PAS, ATPase and Fis domain
VLNSSEAANGPGETGPGYAVLLCDTTGHSSELIPSVVAQCGMTIVTLVHWSRVQSVTALCPARIALIAVRHVTSDVLAGVADLRRHGFEVVACGESADGWSLGDRCRLMLVGCCAVLDTASTEFQPRLRNTLVTALRVVLESSEDTRRLRQVMHAVGIVGESPALIDVTRRLQRISHLSDLPTLITGETGTGKELLARAIHRLDPKRRGGPFVAVNASAIASTLVESELFGHRRGAFTGADRERQGLIRAAHCGVLFLDEIGEIDSSLQAKLLRVLQEGRVLPVGDDRDVAVSVRVIAATNADLPALVERGAFRADLYHRLNVLPLHVPPLRDRKVDIGPMVDHFVRLHRPSDYPDRAQSPTADGEFVAALSRLDLPGNARQLESIVCRALLHSSADAPLGIGDLPPDVWREVARAEETPSTVAPAPPERDWNLVRSLASYERLLLESALRETGGNQSRAAQLLGVTSRSVYNMIRRHHLD